jgi:HEAT repeat protein
VLDNLLAELTCGDDQRAEAAAREFPNLPQELREGALARLGLLLDSGDVDTRWWSTRAIAALSDPGSTHLLVIALQDEETSVRQCAALGCRHQQDEGAIPALVAALSDEDQLVVKLAGDALAEIGEPAVPTLLEVLDVGKPRARLEVVRALAKSGDRRAVPALIAVLGEESALMAYWAEEGLERMGVGMVFYYP